MFKKLKTKLTILYTFSLLFLLLFFIGILYVFISNQINQNENEELHTYLTKEKMHIIEDLYEEEHRGLKYDPNREIFYYVFNKKEQFNYGVEKFKRLSGWIEEYNLKSNNSSFSKKITWKNTHLILTKRPLKTNGYIHGYVILGKDVSSEQHLIEKITWGLVFLTVLFSLLYGIMGYSLAGQALKPIRKAFTKQQKFVSDASHELRTPLSIFYSSIDLLLREEKDRLSSLGMEVLEDVKTEAKLMNQLVNDLLFLARSDQNMLAFDKKEINLSELLTSQCTRFSRKEKENIDFIYNIDKDITFTCDETRIQQLLYILLDNAFRYTKEGKVQLDLKMKPGRITITVSDTGSGISLNDLPYIFDRFYRSDLSRKKGGSGLGLSIAKAIVTAHDGKIFASSDLGKGTVFTIIFDKN